MTTLPATHDFLLTPFEKPGNQENPKISGQIKTNNTDNAQEINTFELQFCITENSPCIYWPPTRQDQARRTDELWKSTCFEMFAGEQNSNTYREYNFASNRDWNCYEFSEYRKNMTPVEIHTAPQIKYSRPDNNTHLLTILLAATDLPNTNNGQSTQLDIGISAVIQYDDKTYDYYALKHSGSQADFHLRESFILSLKL